MSEGDAVKVNKPKESAYWQQKLKAWSPVMTPLRIIIVLLSIGAAFIPTGLYLMSAATSQYEKTIVYDSTSTMDASCSIDTINQNLQCPVSLLSKLLYFVFIISHDSFPFPQITVTLSQDVTGPIYVYYELYNYYQNQRNYALNFYVSQLHGEYVPSTDTYLQAACTPLVKNGTQLRNPCGLVAASFFTDIISLSSSSSTPTTVSMDETGIAWAYDKSYVFQQPIGFSYKGPYTTAQTCASVGLDTSCKTYMKGGNYYYYFYPRDSETYYLYEMFPQHISPLEGVTNEHFMVWMKTAALPNFRKLYGKISRGSGSNYFKKGDVLVFNVAANFYVKSFSGKKALVLTTQGTFGAANSGIGIAYLVCGCLCGVLALFFILVQLIRPRGLGTAASLKWE